MSRNLHVKLLTVVAAVAAAGIVAGGPGAASSFADTTTEIGPFQSIDDVTGYYEIYGHIDGRFESTTVRDVCPGTVYGAGLVNSTGMFTAEETGNGVRVKRIDPLKMLGGDFEARVMCTVPVDVGAAPVGASAERTLKLKGAVSIDRPLEVKLAGEDAKEFSISADECKDKDLPRSETCTVTLSFRPTSPGVKHATLMVAPKPWGFLPHGLTSNVQPRVVPLTGAGVPSDSAKVPAG